MRFLRSLLSSVAILLLGVVTPVQAWARPLSAQSQAGGQVVQVGYDGHFHPTSWVPMKVRITPPAGETGVYQLRVHQRDLDGDHVIYQRTVTLTGGLANQDFWVYFKPQPVDTLPSRQSRDVGERLRVVLADEGGRELAQLRMATPIAPLYVGGGMSGGFERGQRLVLLVADNPSYVPGTDEYGPEGVVGLTEEPRFVSVTPDALPDRSIGYETVDAVVWQDADPDVLRQGGGERMLALRQWVSRGGKLVVSARSEWESLEPLFDLLPVTPTGAVERPDLGPVQSLVEAGLDRAGGLPADLRMRMSAAWRAAQGPDVRFRFILGTPKPDAIVDDWFEYEKPPELGGGGAGEAPLIARRPEGFGSVTWVAIDLSNQALRGRSSQRTTGWSIVWSRVLGLGDTPVMDPRSEVRIDYAGREYRDLGHSLLPGSRLAGRSMALVTVALVFFIAYWLIAGPGLYFYLVAKRRTPLSWFLFGAAAVAATFVTLGVVNLILRGPPDLRHISIARQGSVAPQLVHSEMGLYIPEDGSQRIAIDGGAAGLPPTLTAFAIDPEQHRGGGGRSNPIEYVVSLDPPDERAARGLEGTATVVDIPYRSTLKKLEADWSGPVARGVTGDARLVASSRYCETRLTNNTGRNLTNVHIAFRYNGSQDHVRIVYIPTWPAGQQLPDLGELHSPSQPNVRRIRRVDRTTTAGLAPPSPTEAVSGTAAEWGNYWYSFLRASMVAAPTSSVVDDWNERVRRTPAMLSFFSLLPPMKRETQGIGTSEPTRLLRNGARELDVSGAVMAGNLVIVAEADDVEVPLPLQVDGRAVKGAGRIIYQFVLPLDRSDLVRAEEERRRQDAEEAEQGQPAEMGAEQ